MVEDYLPQIMDGLRDSRTILIVLGFPFLADFEI